MGQITNNRKQNHIMLSQNKQGRELGSLIVPTMKQQRAFVSAILLSSTLIFSGCLGDDLDVISDTVENFTSVNSIEVDGEFLDIEYIGESGKQDVSMVAQIKSNSDNKFEVVSRMNGDILVIEVKKNKAFLGKAKAEGSIKLIGPRNMNLVMEVGSGSIIAQQVVNNTSFFEVASGEMLLKNISSSSEIKIVSSSGKVVGENLAGKVSLALTSGSVNLSKVDGNIEADASSGEFKFSDVNGKVNLVASSGKAELSNVKSIGKAHMSSGQLFATNTGLSNDTSLKVSSGTIYIQTASRLKDYNFNITTGSGSARVGDVASSGALNINNGAITTIRGEVSSGKIEIVN